MIERIFSFPLIKKVYVKSHKISKQSAGYKMMVRHGMIRPHFDEPTNICEYRSCYIKTIFRILLIGLGVFSGLFPIMDTAIWAFASAQVGIWYIHGIHPYTVVFWLSMATGAIGAAVLFGGGYIFSHLANHKPGTIRLMYYTWKDKFCVPVEFE